MNIEFIIYPKKDNNESVSFNSTSFPSYISFKKSDRIKLSAFDLFLSNGQIYLPDNNDSKMDLSEFPNWYTITKINHTYDKTLGYILIVTLIP